MMETSYQKPKPISPADAEEIKARLEIKDGEVVWRQTGELAGTPVKGYLRIWIAGRRLAAHHIAWLLHHGEWPSCQIDHINQVKTDNRKANLRTASNSQNMINRGLQSNSTSGIKHVTWHKATKKWRADVRRNGKKHSLGVFESKEDAAIAVQRFLAAIGWQEGAADCKRPRITADRRAAWQG